MARANLEFEVTEIVHEAQESVVKLNCSDSIGEVSAGGALQLGFEPGNRELAKLFDVGDTLEATVELPWN